MLNDKSKVPKRKRVARWDPKIVEYIRELRQQYPRLGKEKIKPFLDEFCRLNNLKPISSSTIGKIYQKEKSLFSPPKGHPLWQNSQN